MEPRGSTYGECETFSKIFYITIPFTRYLPYKIGEALGAGRWRHAEVPFTYIRSASAVTIEGMADYLHRLICSMSPEGPYILFGQCYAGLLTFEVAQRLVAAGHSVSMVVIVDSYPTIPRTPHILVQSVLRRAASFAKLDVKSQMSALCRKFFPVRDMRHFIGREVCIRALRQYRPCPYRGRVILFRPSKLLEDQDPTAWRRLVLGEFIEHVVNMHDDQDRVTDESLQSAFNQIAAKLRETSFLQLGEGATANYGARDNNLTLSDQPADRCADDMLPYGATA
jgi:hypothetical protein